MNTGTIRIACDAILFDLDGVLIDSTPAVTCNWTQWAVVHGFNSEEVIQRAHGRPSISTIREYLPEADHAAELEEFERCEIDNLEGIVPLPGALPLLTSIPRNRWAIVTSCTRSLAEVRIRAAGLPLPDLLLTATDVANGKPHPEPYLKAASGLGFSPDGCVVIEDAPAGIRAGKAAHMTVVALRTTMKESVLQAAAPDWIVNNCASISAESSNACGLNLFLHLNTSPGRL